MKETMQARVMAPAIVALAMLVALFAGLENADVAKAYDVRYEEQLACGTIDLSSRTEPIPLYKGMTKHFTIKVLAYKSPAKTLKVGKRNYAKLFKSTSFANSWGVYGVPGKIKIKPASGWHVSSWRGTRHLGVADPAWGSACVNPPARADRLGRGAGRRFAFVGWGWYCQRIEIVYRAM